MPIDNIERINESELRITEYEYLHDDVGMVTFIIDKIDGDELDTNTLILIDKYAIGGSQRHRFLNELNELLKKYRI